MQGDVLLVGGSEHWQPFRPTSAGLTRVAPRNQGPVLQRQPLGLSPTPSFRVASAGSSPPVPELPSVESGAGTDALGTARSLSPLADRSLSSPS